VITDLITIEYARNAIILFSLSGLLLAYVSVNIPEDMRLASGLFVGQLGVLGLVAGSIIAVTLAVASGAAALTGMVIVLFVSRFRYADKTRESKRVLFHIGFFLAAALSVLVFYKTNFARPRIEELLFGRIFTTSVEEIILLLVVAAFAVIATFAVRRLLNSGQSTNSEKSSNAAFLLLAICSGPIVPLIGVFPFAALVVLLPGSPDGVDRPRMTSILVSGTHVALSAIAGVYIALEYGIPGAPTVTAFVAFIAVVRYVSPSFSRK
jgi:ABC-type Mn2+/Zn2+ transport system permease subunit